MIKNTTRRFSGLRNAGCTVGFAGAMLLTACATTPPEPTVALKAAEQAIEVADRAPTAGRASPELTEARARLTAAQGAAQRKDMTAAERLALESRLDAELALARQQAMAATAVNDEMKHSNDTLAAEMARSSGVKQ